MGQAQAEGLGHHLRGGGRAQELAAAAGGPAGFAAHLGGVIEASIMTVGEAGADGLHGAGVFRAFGGQRSRRRAR